MVQRWERVGGGLRDRQSEHTGQFLGIYRELGSPSVELGFDLTVLLWTDACRCGVKCGVPSLVDFGGTFGSRAIDDGAPYRYCFRQRVRDALPGSGRIHQDEPVAWGE